MVSSFDVPFIVLRYRFSVTVTNPECEFLQPTGYTVMKHADRNHKSNQGNPNNPAHQQVNDNRSNQGNPNNPAYHSSRSQPTGPKKP
jgi:hypothetical protein